LATWEDAYQGTLVRTHGVVRMFEPPRHYWIEDSELNRVALEPEALVAPWLGYEIRVVRRFHFDDRHGRLIQVKDASSIAAPAVLDMGGDRRR
jgi:hypothetical protein